MKEACVQQLLEVADDAQVDQLLDVASLALTKLLALQPRGRQHPPRSQLLEGPWHGNLDMPRSLILAFQCMLAYSGPFLTVDATMGSHRYGEHT